MTRTRRIRVAAAADSDTAGQQTAGDEDADTRPEAPVAAVPTAE